MFLYRIYVASNYKMCLFVHVIFDNFFPSLKTFEVFQQVSIAANIKFQGNLSNGRQTNMRTDGQTD